MMKILLAVTDKNDPRAMGAYLARRFAGKEVEFDVLTVLNASAETADENFIQDDMLDSSGMHGTYHQLGSTLVEVFASELQARLGTAMLRTHVEYGDAADVILACCDRWHSDLVLIEAPHRKGLLTAFRIDGVTRRIFAKARCPVELLRTNDTLATARFNVLIPVALEQLRYFPFAQLESLPWTQGCCIHLVGVIPPAFDESLVEASAAAVVKALQECSHYRLRALERLQKYAQELSRVLGEGIQIEHQVLEGSPRDVTGECASRLQASLIILADSGDATRDTHSTPSPVAIAMSTFAPVLLLRSAPACAEGAVAKPAPGYARLSSQ